jgi:hypothetical protein
VTSREVFHVSLPTPLHESVVIPTILLIVLKFALGLPWWVMVIPLALDVAFIVLFLVALHVVVKVHNAQNRRHVRGFMR